MRVYLFVVPFVKMFARPLREEWPKEKRSEIMFSFCVSDMHSRKLQQRLNEKLWLVENYLRTLGTWRSSGASHIAQCSQNSSKSTRYRLNNDIDLNSPPLLHHPHLTSTPCPTLATRGHKCACNAKHLVEVRGSITSSCC